MISDFGTLFLLINVFTSVWHAEGLVNRLLNFCNEKFVIIVFMKLFIVEYLWETF